MMNWRSLGCGLILVFGCLRVGDGTSEPVHGTERHEGILAIGYVEPASELRKLRFEIDGVIGRCLVAEGDKVSAGQPLMTFRRDVEAAEVSLWEGNVALAKAEKAQANMGVNPKRVEAARKNAEASRTALDLARKDLSRLEELFAQQAISPSEVDRARALVRTCEANLQSSQAEVLHLESFVRPEDCAVAQAKVVLAERNLELARARLERTTLRSPIEGEVLRIIAREGEAARLQDPMPVMILGDTTRLNVRAEVDERFVAVPRPGMRAIVTAQALEKGSHEGRVRSVQPIMGKKTLFSYDSAERRDLDSMEVLIEMDEEFHAPIGLQVDVRLIEERKAAVAR